MVTCGDPLETSIEEEIILEMSPLEWCKFKDGLFSSFSFFNFFFFLVCVCGGGQLWLAG